MVWCGSLFAAIASCFAVPESWPMPIGLGGVFGDLVLRIPGIFLGAFRKAQLRRALHWFWLSRHFGCAFASGIIGRGNAATDGASERGASAEDDYSDYEDADDEASSGGLSAFVGSLTHTIYSATATFKRLTGMNRRKPRDDEYGDMRQVRRSAEARGNARHEPGFGGAASEEPPFDMDGDGEDMPLAGEEWHDAPPQRSKARVGERAPHQRAARACSVRRSRRS